MTDKGFNYKDKLSGEYNKVVASVLETILIGQVTNCLSATATDDDDNYYYYK